MAESKETEAGSAGTSSWRTVEVPTEGVPGPLKAISRSAPGKVAYYVASDTVLFLRLATVVAAIAGLLWTVLDLWTIRGAPASAVWAAFFFNLLVTLVAVAVLYGLRVLVTLNRNRD